MWVLWILDELYVIMKVGILEKRLCMKNDVKCCVNELGNKYYAWLWIMLLNWKELELNIK